ncbi:hypothetical protein O2V63_06890 [Modestobacter sp. VKM Ac-2977]|uniref:hypothetical protein n=1 Tax=Modestobacter sp. VKM Ac-2977 TaxID=3004131 RepID=UPI0022AA2A7E|nr:hypothetical protein [Modestobacter sp. VKM Ac-2977]MCZ2820046.1 hypothetical protein [Modestobacter sp. VKM Ac-2977]
MEVRGVDPRDVGWEVDQPRYRVYFWWGTADPAGSPPGQSCDEYELTGPDVAAASVLAWAAEQAGERRADWFEVFVVVDHVPGDRGLVRLTPSR